MSAAHALTEPVAPALEPLPIREKNRGLFVYATTAILLFGPLAFGAVEPWAIFVLQSTSAILFLAWLLSQVRRARINLIFNPIFWPMCAFGGIILLQSFGSWAYRHATISALMLYAAYGLICFLITQTLNRTTLLQRMAIALACFGTALALLAVLQSLSSGGKIYWMRAPRFGGWIYGPYVNHNHYAGLMEMLAPIPLVFAFTRYARKRMRWIAASAAAFMAATIFLSGSRGGMIAFAFEMTLFILLLLRQRTQNRVAYLLSGFLLVALSSVAAIGGREVTNRLSTLAPASHSDLAADIRLRIDRDTWRMFSRRPITGWGVGTFATVYPQFQSFYTTSHVNAAHNDYLQTLAETGIAGFAAAIWLLIITIRKALKKIPNWPNDVNGAASVAALLGISGILVHSFFDFNLQIPANAMLFFALCTVAALEPRFRNHRRERHTHRDNECAATSEKLFAECKLTV